MFPFRIAIASRPSASRIRVGIVVIGLFMTLMPASTVYAAGITVTTTADSLDAAATCAAVTIAALPGPDGRTSLREAVCAANANPGADTITFSVNGIFALTGAADENNGDSGDLDVKQSLAINGNGFTNTRIDGNSIERAFDVFPTEAMTFALSNLTVQNGDTRLELVQGRWGHISGHPRDQHDQ